MFEPLRLSKGTTFWWHLFPLPPVPIDQYNNGAPRHHNSFSLSFYPRALHNKVAGISQPWRVSSITWHRAKERGWRDGSASKLWGAREPQPKKSRGLPICQQSQLTSVRDRGSRRSFMHQKKKNKGSLSRRWPRSHFFCKMKTVYSSEPDWTIHQRRGESNWNLTFRASTPLLTGTDMNYSEWQIVCIKPVPGWSLW